MLPGRALGTVADAQCRAGDLARAMKRLDQRAAPLQVGDQSGHDTPGAPGCAAIRAGDRERADPGRRRAGYGRKRMPSIQLNTAALAPMPSVRHRIASSENTGLRQPGPDRAGRVAAKFRSIRRNVKPRPACALSSGMPAPRPAQGCLPGDRSGARMPSRPYRSVKRVEVEAPFFVEGSPSLPRLTVAVERAGTSPWPILLKRNAAPCSPLW